jgi:hypothetical protein
LHNVAPIISVNMNVQMIDRRCQQLFQIVLIVKLRQPAIVNYAMSSVRSGYANALTAGEGSV